MTAPVRMLDTDTVSYFIKRRHPLVERRLTELTIASTCISAVTMSEMLYGVQPLGSGHRHSIAIDQFLAEIAIAPWDANAALVHARVRRQLEALGQTIGTMDQMIAAHAISLDLILVTNNTRHYGRLEPELTIENWVAAAT